MRDANRELAAVRGFSSAIGIYGGFYIPMSRGMSISITGGPAGALYGFIAFHLSCIAMTWWFYSRRDADMPC